ncbi:MAG: tetratricopeptide repeat protein, partial [Sphingomonas sp.]
MTSSPDRSNRTGPRPSILRRALVALGCMGAFAIALYGFFGLSGARANAETAQAAVERSLQQLRESNFTEARRSALDAVRADPGSATAHHALALAQLRLGDGVAAEAEINRAVEAGYDAKRVAPARAQAILLQGSPERALAESAKTDPRDRVAGLRVRGKAMTLLENWGEALAALQEAVRLAPADADAWIDLGRCRL